MIGPFKDFDVAWYLVVGSLMVAIQLVMIFVPHFTVLLTESRRFLRRCRDRKFTCDSKKTV